MDKSLRCIRENLLQMCNDDKNASLFLQIRAQIIPKETIQRMFSL